MVKFSKELEAQLIPEWKDAFVNYWQLKKHIKKIKLARKNYKPHDHLSSDFGRSIFDPIRFVANKFSSNLFGQDNKASIIQVTYCACINLQYLLDMQTGDIEEAFGKSTLSICLTVYVNRSILW